MARDMNGTESRAKPPLRLLCLDGGGIRGISELLIIKEIMHGVQISLQLEHLPLPADYFDMIGGTSTGGLVAILLGRLRMSITDAIDVFTRFSTTIFGEKQSRWRGSKYSAKTFENVIKSVIKSKLGAEGMKMRDTEEQNCKSFVCSVSPMSVPQTRLFRSYQTPGPQEHDCTIWEAARATSAAPTYFPRILIGPAGGEEEFFDGGIGSNNPIKELHAEAEQVFDKNRQVACIISIGTGVRPANQVESSGLLENITIPIHLIKGFKRMALSSERFVEDMEQKYLDMQGLYFRLNVDKGLQSIGLADSARLGEVATHTHAYLSTPAMRAKIRDIVDAVCGGSTGLPRQLYALAQLSMSNQVVIQATVESLVQPRMGIARVKTECSKYEAKARLLTWLLPSHLYPSTPAQDQRNMLKKRFRDEEAKYATCDWLFQTNEYQAFVKSERPALLYIRGPPGCGKSVLASAIIDSLTTSLPKEGEATLFFYCHRDPSPSSASAIVRALLAQTTQWEGPEALAELDSLSQEYPMLEDENQDIESKLWSLLDHLLALKSGRVNIIIDGLDECRKNASPFKKLVELTIQSTRAISRGLILLSRPDDAVVEAVMDHNDEYMVHLKIAKHHTKQDLAHFVSARVNHKQSPLRRKSQKVRDEIVSRISDQADGLFLYATLVLDELKGDKIASVAAIRKTFGDLPHGLYQIYERNLEKPRESAKGAEVFQWISCATRPLTWRELKSGLEMEDLKFSEDSFIDESSEIFLQYSCGSLVEVLGDDKETIRFIHPTVKDFLINSKANVDFPGIISAHDTAAIKLLAFLNDPGLPDISPFSTTPPQTIIDEFENRPGRGLYSYAVFNWYRHLKECIKSPNKMLEKQLCSFLTSTRSVQWLATALSMSLLAVGHCNSGSLATDVIDGLEGWLLHRSWEADESPEQIVQTWIQDFLHLMLDWEKALDAEPTWAHFLHHQLLAEGNQFRQIIGSTSEQSVVHFGPRDFLTRSRLATNDWLKRCFAFDFEREYAYSFDGSVVSCYHLRTALMIAETRLPISTEANSRVALKGGLLCPRKKYLALILTEIDESETARNIEAGLRLVLGDPRLAWRLEQEHQQDASDILAQAIGLKERKVSVCLLELHYVGMTRTQLFGYPSWSSEAVLHSGSERFKWKLDDADFLAFSPDSRHLSTPFGVFDLATGSLKRSWSYATDLAFRGGNVTADCQQIGIVRTRTDLELYHVETGSLIWKKQLPHVTHLLAISDQGRYFLLVRTQQFHVDDEVDREGGELPYKVRPQRGTIGVYDRMYDIWTPLLALQPPQSVHLSSWEVPRHCQFFSSQHKGIESGHRVLIHVPPGWLIDNGVRRGTLPERDPRDSRMCIYVFEAEKFKSGFGLHPSVKFMLPIKNVSSLGLSCVNSQSVILSWDATFETARVHSDALRSPVLVMDTKQLIGLASESIEDLTGPPTMQNRGEESPRHILLYSSTSSTVYQIELRVADESITGSASSMIRIMQLRAGDPITYRTDVQVPRAVASMDRNRVKALISADEKGRLSLGGITLDASKLSVVSQSALDIADDGLLLHAIDKFKSIAHPFTATPEATEIVAKQQPLLSGPGQRVGKGHGFTDGPSTVPEITTIHFDILQRGQAKDPETAPETAPGQASRAFDVVGAYVGLRSKYYILESVTPLGSDPETVSAKREARQFEVFLCAYEKATDNISWLMHTFSAGERLKGVPGIPFTSWALHPVLPILAWLIPGHSLRIARMDSHESPITLSGPLTIEVSVSQALMFSPNGRYLVVQAHDSFKNDFMEGVPKNVKTIRTFDLITGSSSAVTLSNRFRLSVEVDDEALRIYRLTDTGAVEMYMYLLPDLIGFEQHYLTFVPSQCLCSDCGVTLNSDCHVAVTEYQGIRSVFLSHGTTNEGKATIGQQECHPLVLRMSHPPIPAAGTSMHQSLVATIDKTSFPPLLTHEGQIRQRAFDVLLQLSTQEAGNAGNQDAENPDNDAYTKLKCARQMFAIVSNSKHHSGSLLQPHEFENILRHEEAKAVAMLAFGADVAKKAKEVYNSIMEDFMPFDTWEDFKTSFEELADTEEYAEFANFMDFERSGVGCSLPLFVQTVKFKGGGKDDDEDDYFNNDNDKRDFAWSSAADVGWIQESLEWFFERFLQSEFATARRWYEFRRYHDLPFAQKMRHASRNEAKQFRFVLQTRKERKKSKREEDKVGGKEGSEERDEEGGEEKDEDDDANPLLFMKDFLEQFEDLVPGCGRLMRERLEAMLFGSVQREIVAW